MDSQCEVFRSHDPTQADVSQRLAATGRLRFFGSPKEHGPDLQIAAEYFEPRPAPEISSKLERHIHELWRATSRSSLSGPHGPNPLPTSDDKPCIRMMRFLLDRRCAGIRRDVSTGFWVDLPVIASTVARDYDENKLGGPDCFFT